ncbi:unnamed protein product, partial [Oppiella nova]
KDFSGKVVLITGSNSGLGAEIARLFAYLGAQVVITGRDVNRVNIVAQEVYKLSPKGLKPLQVVADVTKSDDLKRLVNESIAAFKKIDILVNNSGGNVFHTIKDKDFMQTFDFIIQLNLRALVEMTHLTVPYLEKTKGVIINISGIGALSPHTRMLGYSASRVAVDMTTKILALELGASGIRVNGINVGVCETPAVDGTKDNMDPNRLRAEVSAKTPLGRMGVPIDVAKSVVFLASSDAEFITGANLLLDGGYHYNFEGNYFEKIFK